MGSVETNLSMYYSGILTSGQVLQFWNRRFYDVDCTLSNISITLPPLPSAITTNTSGSIMIRRIDNTSNSLTIKWNVGGMNRSLNISDTVNTYWFMALNDPYAEDPLLITKLNASSSGGGGGGGTLSALITTQALNISDTAMFVDTVDGFPDTGYVLVGSEMIRYDVKQSSPPALGVLQRGMFGSSASTHAIGTAVNLSGGLAFSDLTADRVVVTDPLTGQLIASGTTATTLSYLDIGSSLTGLLNNKLSLSGGDLTGNLSLSGLSALLPSRNGNTTLGYSDNGALLDAISGPFSTEFDSILPAFKYIIASLLFILQTPKAHCIDLIFHLNMLHCKNQHHICFLCHRLRECARIPYVSMKVSQKRTFLSLRCYRS